MAIIGPDEFKRAVAVGLALARPPVKVVNYTPPRDDVVGLPEASDIPLSI